MELLTIDTAASLVLIWSAIKIQLFTSLASFFPLLNFCAGLLESLANARPSSTLINKSNCIHCIFLRKQLNHFHYFKNWSGNFLPVTQLNIVTSALSKITWFHELISEIIITVTVPMLIENLGLDLYSRTYCFLNIRA